MSGRSFTRKSAPAAAASGRMLSAAVSSSRLVAPFKRSCRQRAPPARNAFARKTGVRPVSSGSTIAYSAGRRMRFTWRRSTGSGAWRSRSGGRSATDDDAEVADLLAERVAVDAEHLGGLHLVAA